LVVPFPPGGNTDIIARAIGNELGKNLGAPLVIDNRGGAGSTIGTAIVTKAPADGYTILMVSGAFVINPSMFKNLPYDSIKDLAGITMVADVPAALVVHPSVPAKNLKELIAYAKANPGKLNHASSGKGSIGHLAGELLASMADIKLTHVPYKGSGPAVIDVLGGYVQMLITSIPSVMPHIKSGKLRAIALAGTKRSSGAPEIPTFIESGLPGFIVSGGFGLLAPAKTPREVIKTIHAATVKSLKDPAVRERLASQGADPVGSTPEEFDAFNRSEIEKWVGVAKKAGIESK
ncbi:MAG: tripartite tricarboxylate transporter substrate binding protein, partial [Proteobacteria bacterium]|nr:tripartite tricarboxylate transporter substrate binding protein [Pseudomonadota bacterium]